MEIYREIFDFAASAGALEGYVYPRKKEVEADELNDWVSNLVKQYGQLPKEIRTHFQSSIDRTLGRAIHSLIPICGENHDHVIKLKSLIVGKMPASHQDFEQEKTEKAGQ